MHKFLYHTPYKEKVNEENLALSTMLFSIENENV
jgi:hypothetical protein